MNRDLGFCADITTNKCRKSLDLEIFKANHFGHIDVVCYGLIWCFLVCVLGGGELSNSAYAGLGLV